MTILRQAKPSDKAEFRKLWDICFTDSNEFRDWYFENRYIPCYSVCMEQNGKIVSKMHSMPYNIKVRDFIVNGTLVAGVCTLPEYWGKGYMKEVYKYYMNLMYKNGQVVCVNTPVNLKTYLSVNHYPLSDTTFITIEKSTGCNCMAVEDVDMRENESALFECYTLATEKYSGIIKRSMADFRLKCDDYAADGGKCMVYNTNNTCMAYAVYYETDEMLFAEEVIALDSESEQIIADALVEKGRGKKVTIKLPPDSKTVCNQGIKETAPRNVGAIINVSKLFKMVGKNLKNTIEITDSVISENNGVFNMCGDKVNEKPQLEMPIYRVAQWIFGYKSLEEMEKLCEINVNDRDAMTFLDRAMPKQICHIIDEY